MDRKEYPVKMPFSEITNFIVIVIDEHQQNVEGE